MQRFLHPYNAVHARQAIARTTCRGSRTSKLQYVRDLGEEHGDLHKFAALGSHSGTQAVSVFCTD